MKRAQREIGLLLICLVLVSGFVSLFFRLMHTEQTRERISAFALFPERPDAVLYVKNGRLYTALMRNVQPLVSDRKLASVYDSLSRDLPLSNLLFTLHPQGAVAYWKVSPEGYRTIRRHIGRQLGAFAPQTQTKWHTTVEYYADANGRFLGSFYKNGFWVASYNASLLEKVLKNMLYAPDESPAIYAPIEQEMAYSSTSLWLYAPLVDIDIQQPDSLHWSIGRTWLQVDLLPLQHRVMASSSFTQIACNDSLAYMIADSLQKRLFAYWKLSSLAQDSLEVQLNPDEKLFSLRLAWTVGK